MERVRVDAANGSYEIEIGANALSNVKERLPRGCVSPVVVTDTNVGPLYSNKLGLDCPVITVPAGEESKSGEKLLWLYDEMSKYDVTRSDCIIALGGGVVGDLAGFAAATYLRGVPYIQAPTSLLAQVDSSVGGKTAIDLPSGKNRAGAFYQPVYVSIDTDALATLPERERRCGMAEIIKYGVIADEKLLSPDDDIEKVIKRCCEIKAEIVSEDPNDKGLRMMLNFGHTLGHAVEKCAGFGKLTHGEGVAIGMVQAARWSEALNAAQHGIAAAVEKAIEAAGLPTRIPDGIDIDSVLAASCADKKNSGNGITVVLAERIGKGVLRRLTVAEFASLVRECV